ncbi:MAG: hypothetical protein ACKV2V_07910 [Blastocatellia bacterium]
MGALGKFAHRGQEVSSEAGKGAGGCANAGCGAGLTDAGGGISAACGHSRMQQMPEIVAPGPVRRAVSQQLSSQPPVPA